MKNLTLTLAILFLSSCSIANDKREAEKIFTQNIQGTWILNHEGSIRIKQNLNLNVLEGTKFKIDKNGDFQLDGMNFRFYEKDLSTCLPVAFYLVKYNSKQQLIQIVISEDKNRIIFTYQRDNMLAFEKDYANIQYFPLANRE